MAQASAEKVEHSGHAEKERVVSVPQREQSTNTPKPSLKEKEQCRLSRVPDHEEQRVKVSESRTLASKREIRARARERKSGLHSEVGRFYGGEGGQA